MCKLLQLCANYFNYVQITSIINNKEDYCPFKCDSSVLWFVYKNTYRYILLEILLKYILYK